MHLSKIALTFVTSEEKRERKRRENNTICYVQSSIVECAKVRTSRYDLGKIDECSPSVLIFIENLNSCVSSRTQYAFSRIVQFNQCTFFCPIAVVDHINNFSENYS